MRRLPENSTLQFLVLFRQFLLRVIDLEALSIQADVIGFLGQFAGVLIMLSMIHAVRAYVFIPRSPWYIEQYLIETMMLVVGLIAIISWDTTFPDRQDVLILAPLPVAPRTILFAKIAASAALVGLAILALNFAPGFVGPLRLATQRGSSWFFFQSLAAYWFTMIAASVFLYCSVLAVQGLTALLLPRRLFLRVSAFLQVAAFTLFLGVYFLQSSVATATGMAASKNHWLLASSPSFWFFALFNQLNGSLPADLVWLARRAWIGLAVAVLGASTSLLLCYLRTMKRTVGEPDLMPGARGSHQLPRFGSSLQAAIVLFSVRSLTRSRPHRVAFAFFLAVVFAIALSSVKAALSIPAPRPLTADYMMSTLVMMNLAVVGLRGVFSLPISLKANWVLRVTQLFSSDKYILGTRRTLLLLGALPIWLCAGLLSLLFRPLHESAIHLVVLALVGFIMTDLSLIGVSKIPFACSYLPGKSNVQYMFWAFLIIVVPIAISFSMYEQRALHNPLQFASMIGVLGAIAMTLWLFNRRQAKSAVLYFEELPPELITTLGLSSARPSEAKTFS